jgi:hypothetical protein
MQIEHIPEPKLLFGHGQYTEDPRDGLLLFGPYERWHTSAKQRTLHAVSIGVIGSARDIENYKHFEVVGRIGTGEGRNFAKP